MSELPELSNLASDMDIPDLAPGTDDLSFSSLDFTSTDAYDRCESPYSDSSQTKLLGATETNLAPNEKQAGSLNLEDIPKIWKLEISCETECPSRDQPCKKRLTERDNDITGKDLNVSTTPYSYTNFKDTALMQSTKFNHAHFASRSDAVVDQTIKPTVAVSSTHHVKDSSLAKAPSYSEAEFRNHSEILWESKVSKESNPGFRGVTTQDSEVYSLYSLQPTLLAGYEAIFFIERKSSLPKAQGWFRSCPMRYKIELTHPNGSKQSLVLHQDPTPSKVGRFFCSFYPTHTGMHILSVVIATTSRSSSPLSDADYQHILGSPLYACVTRSYYNSFEKNFVFMNLSSNMQVASKVSGISVYRPYNWIYMVDRGCHEIVILDESSRILKKFGTMGSGPEQLFRPAGIAVDQVYQRVFVSDKDNHRVSVFDLDGNFVFSFGKKGHQNGEFNYPWGLAVSPNGQVIAVADSRNYRLQLFDCNGYFLRKFSIFETKPFRYKQEFYYPRGVAFSLDGNKIYVTDFTLHSIFELSLDLETKTTFVPKGHLYRPQGLAVDDAGNVIVADYKNDCVRILSNKGTLICSLSGSGRARFERPVDVAVLRGGRVVVVDKENRLRIF